MISIDIGGHELEFDIPDNAIITGAVAVINYQVMSEDGQPRGASYVAKSAVERPTAIGMFTIGQDWARNDNYFQGEDDE